MSELPKTATSPENVRRLNQFAMHLLLLSSFFGNVDFVVSQVTSAPFSEVVVPILQPLEVTEITFWDVSGNDSGGCTPNCGTQIDPGAVATGDTIWARATVTDLFGSDDINTGCSLTAISFKTATAIS